MKDAVALLHLGQQQSLALWPRPIQQDYLCTVSRSFTHKIVFSIVDFLRAVKIWRGAKYGASRYPLSDFCLGLLKKGFDLHQIS